MHNILFKHSTTVKELVGSYIAETGYPLTVDEVLHSVDEVIPISMDGTMFGIFGYKSIQSDVLGKVAKVVFVYVLEKYRHSFKSIVRYVYEYLGDKGFEYIESHLDTRISVWYIRKLQNFPMSYLHLTNIKDTLGKLEEKG